MPELRRRLPVSLLLAGLIAAAVVGMVVDRRGLASGGGRDLPAWLGSLLDVAAPVQKAVSAPFEAVRDGVRRYVALVETERKNATLRAEIDRLADENLQLREALVAGGRLQRIAEMRKRYEVPMLPAELVGVDVSPWFHSVLLDRGRDRGVRSGMPVISAQGLVGLVTATSRTAAKAMLVVDGQTAIDGAIQRSRSRGLVRGRGTELLDFEFIARDSDVAPGDVVITSGLGGVYPKGLLIGTVVEISEPGAQLLQTARVKPAVDFGRLEQVFVMLRRGPALELLYSNQTGDEADAEPGS